MKNSSALKGRWPEGLEGFHMHGSNFAYAMRRLDGNASVDVHVNVHVDVRPPPAASRLVPLSGGTVFFHGRENLEGVTTRAKRHEDDGEYSYI